MGRGEGVITTIIPQGFLTMKIFEYSPNPIRYDICSKRVAIELLQYRIGDLMYWNGGGKQG